MEAAVRAFREHGYDNTSMDYISELANASKRTVYNHYPSKEILFQEVINRIIDDIKELKQIKYSPERSLEEQLEKFADAKISIARNKDWMGTMKMAIAVLLSHPEIASETMSKVSSMEDALVQWLKSATKDGRLNVKNAEIASEAFNAMFAGAFFWPALIEGPMESKKAGKLKREFIQTFLQRYR